MSMPRPLFYPRGFPFKSIEGETRWGDLVAGWKFDESSGNRADVLGVYTLSPAFTVNGVAGKISRAADCPDYLYNTAGPRLSGDFTIIGWVKFDDLTANRPIIVRGNAWANNIDYAVYASSATELSGAAGNGSTSRIVTKSGITTGTFYFFCLWHDGVTLYLDIDDSGSPASGSLAGASWSGAGNLTVGRNALLFHDHDGLIDEMYIFSKVKSAAWRTDMYNSGSGRTY